MFWDIYLKRVTFISKRMFVTRQTVYNWRKNNNVPDLFFHKLRTALKELGYDLTETEMRQLNDSKNV